MDPIHQGLTHFQAHYFSFLFPNRWFCHW